ncbi:putative short chain oxidoreductase protein [Lasiodiplodia theobromae]|uniref:Short chain oxidoreductase protein n=1 Tax=Lasiodiplodia theobromae TaxID=45133 RepID=A0A8H7IQM2_9PEZI|nr:putative short chain oxidoreductase protein [Lasiodiplodia theobromae]
MASYLVTGSSRGIGLALVTALASKPTTEVGKVFAASRTENDSLRRLTAKSGGRVEWLPLEVSSQESIKQAASKVAESLGGSGLDVLINNAGVGSKWNKAEDMTDLEDVFKVNVFGVHAVTSAFLPVLKKGSLKKIITVSSILGSIQMVSALKSMLVPAYKISKAAVNSLTVQYALELEKDGFTVVPISPGYAKTDLSGNQGDITPEQSANAVLNFVSRMTTADNGKFYDLGAVKDAPPPSTYFGENPPW